MGGWIKSTFIAVSFFVSIQDSLTSADGGPDHVGHGSIPHGKAFRKPVLPVIHDPDDLFFRISLLQMGSHRAVKILEERQLSPQSLFPVHRSGAVSTEKAVKIVRQHPSDGINLPINALVGAKKFNPVPEIEIPRKKPSVFLFQINRMVRAVAWCVDGPDPVTPGRRLNNIGIRDNIHRFGFSPYDMLIGKNPVAIHHFPPCLWMPEYVGAESFPDRSGIAAVIFVVMGQQNLADLLPGKGA